MSAESGAAMPHATTTSMEKSGSPTSAAAASHSITDILGLKGDAAAAAASAGLQYSSDSDSDSATSSSSSSGSGSGTTSDLGGQAGGI